MLIWFFIIHLQKSQEEVQHDLKSMLAVSPVSKNIQIVCSQLKDSLKQQKDRTTAFERKLMEYQQGSSLKLPIQVWCFVYLSGAHKNIWKSICFKALSVDFIYVQHTCSCIKD